MASKSNGNGSSSALQRFLIGGGTLLVVVLTLIGAILLAMQDTPPEETPLAQASPTPLIVATTPAPPPATNTPVPAPPGDTPTATATLAVAPVEISPTPTTTETPAPLPAATETPTLPPPPPTDTPIPAAPPPTVAEKGGPCQPPANWVLYQVQVGDTLNLLAERTLVSVADLQQVNCLESFTILPGQTIYLPFPPPTATPRPEPTPTGTRRPTPTRTPAPTTPKIGNVNVTADMGAGKILVVVTGENFDPRAQGFRAELRGPTTVILQIGPTATSTSFEGQAPLSAMVLSERYDLVVINPTGRLDIRTDVWPPSDATPTAIPSPPEISRVSPSSGRINQDVLLTIQGRNFFPKQLKFRVELKLDDGSLTVEVFVDERDRPATSTSFDVLIPANALVSGNYDLLVTNPDGQTDIERFAYDALN